MGKQREECNEKILGGKIESWKYDKLLVVVNEFFLLFNCAYSFSFSLRLLLCVSEEVGKRIYTSNQ